MIKFIKQTIKSIQGYFNYLKFNLVETKKIKKAEVVFILPFYHTGGAEKVHLNIVKALKDQKCCVIFTHLSATQNHYEDFKKHAQVIELNHIRNKKSNRVNILLKKIIIKTINNSKTIHTVFGCNTDYFYKLVPVFKKGLKKIDLLHALSHNDDRALSLTNTASVIDFRVCINQKAKQDLISIYKQNNINLDFNNKIKIIENGVSIADFKTNISEYKSDIKFGFIGRWSEEKRPEIFLKVAKQIKTKFPEVEFVMAGTGMKSNLNQINESGVEFLGEITDATKMNNLYKSLTGVVITSVSEGFPMVFMESMPFNVVPVSTNVGGISQHITHMENGLLIEGISNDKLVEEFITSITLLIEDQLLTKKIAKSAKTYAVENFNIVKFNTSYQHLFLKEQ
jgi:glycosyltransferase involved in cell wall biosynthesis